MRLSRRLFVQFQFSHLKLEKKPKLFSPCSLFIFNWLVTVRSFADMTIYIRNTMIAHFSIRSAHRIRTHTHNTILIIFIHKVVPRKKIPSHRIFYLEICVQLSYELNLKHKRSNCFAQFCFQTNHPRNVQLFVICMPLDCIVLNHI